MPSSGAGDLTAPVIVTQATEKGREVFVCACCGRPFAPRKAAMRLAGGSLLSGPICPECVIRGPKGAADLLRRRVREWQRPESEMAGTRLIRRMEPWARLADSKAEELARAEVFPLAARQAAIRETRETR